MKYNSIKTYIPGGLSPSLQTLKRLAIPHFTKNFKESCVTKPSWWEVH